MGNNCCSGNVKLKVRITTKNRILNYFSKNILFFQKIRKQTKESILSIEEKKILPLMKINYQQEECKDKNLKILITNEKDKESLTNNNFDYNLYLVGNKKTQYTNDETAFNKLDHSSIKLNLNKPIHYKSEFIRGKLIGQGRFGSVYSGLSSHTGEIIAIKIYDVPVKLKNTVEEGIERLKSLHHENLINSVPTDLEIGCKSSSEQENLNTENNSLISFVKVSVIYEFCNGSSVKSLLQRYGEFDEKLIRKYVREILEGLKYLHSQNPPIIHKNLKSSNILVDGNGTIRISDILVENILLSKGEEMLENLSNQCINKNKEGVKTNLNTNNVNNSNLEIPYWMSPDLLQDNSIKNPHKNNDLFFYDFWSLGCLIIEMATTKPAWSHYSFTSSQEFIDFLLNTNLIPTFPKKLSKTCHNFLSLLFTRQNKTNHNLPFTIDDLIEHEFFTNPNPINIVESIPLQNSHSGTLSHHKSSNDNKESVNPLPQKNNIVVNILNNNSNEDGAMFSVTVTLNTNSQLHSVLTTRTNNLQSVNTEKYENGSSNQNNNENNFQICQQSRKIIPVLEEASKEYSPNIKDDKDSGKNYFEFNSDSENSYNFVHHAKGSIRNTVNLDVDSLPFKIEENFDKIHQVYNADKFNNFDFVDVISLGTNKEKISSIRPEIYGKLTPSKVKDLDRLDKEFHISENENNERYEVLSYHTIRSINPFMKNDEFDSKKNFMDNLENRISLINDNT
jgi:serine/threonine protein kinase